MAEKEDTPPAGMCVVVFPGVSEKGNIAIHSRIFPNPEAGAEYMDNHRDRPNLMLPWRKPYPGEKEIVDELTAESKLGGPWNAVQWVKDQGSKEVVQEQLCQVRRRCLR